MDDKFTSSPSSFNMRPRASIAQRGSPPLPSNELFFGISATIRNNSIATVALAIHDLFDFRDFSMETIEIDHESGNDPIANHVVQLLQSYERHNMAKFIAAGVSYILQSQSSSLCSRLWFEVDVIPIVMPTERRHDRDTLDEKPVDEQADSMARKCIAYFGPSMMPRLQMDRHGEVQVGMNGMVHLGSSQDYENTCSHASWEMMKFYADRMRAANTKMAFFSAMPQDGGIAPMRHALVRLSRLFDVDIKWYIPKPRPGVFHIIKRMHSILQGISAPNQRVSLDDKALLLNWLIENARRYWLGEGGALRPPDEGGADIVVVDDPEMAGLISISKTAAKHRPVLYCSQLQIRSDLTAIKDSPQSEVWDFIWNHVKNSDAFISQPIPDCVPPTVPQKSIAWMAAAGDWLDGLNKELSTWDTGYYFHGYNVQCYRHHVPELAWPRRKYIIQVSPFDDEEGIAAAIDSYAEFCRQLDGRSNNSLPQLVICQNHSNDSERRSINIQIPTKIEVQYPHLHQDINIMRLGENDRYLNALISNAHVVLQLSTREGFETRILAALYASRPVIACRCRGIQLHVQDGVNGYVVEPSDWKATAQHLLDLFTDGRLHKRISRASKSGLSDEVTTVGNALAWYYLGTKFANDPKFNSHGRGVNAMATEEAGNFYSAKNHLP